MVPANVKKAENCIGGNPIEAQNSDNRFVSYKVQLSLVIVIIGIAMSIERRTGNPGTMHWRSKVKKTSYGSTWNVAKEDKRMQPPSAARYPYREAFCCYVSWDDALSFPCSSVLIMQCINHEKRFWKIKGNMAQVPRQGCSEQRHHNERYPFGRKDP